jgi:hypothetical protein
MTEADRLCACGCGEVVIGRRSRRYVGESHRMRALRSRKAAEEQVSGDVVRHDVVAEDAGRPLPSNGSMGRTRAGLEVWIEKQEVEPDEALTSAARELADRVDADPDNSPLWGRYLDCLRQLQEPAQQAEAWNAAVRELYEELATMDAVEAWRHAKYLKAVDDGEPHPERWTKLVPFGCLLDRHQWHQWGGPDSPRTCLDCRGRLEDDGVVRWPSYLVGTLWEDEP